MVDIEEVVKIFRDAGFDGGPEMRSFVNKAIADIQSDLSSDMWDWSAEYYFKWYKMGFTANQVNKFESYLDYFEGDQDTMISVIEDMFSAGLILPNTEKANELFPENNAQDQECDIEKAQGEN